MIDARIEGFSICQNQSSVCEMEQIVGEWQTSEGKGVEPVYQISHNLHSSTEVRFSLVHVLLERSHEIQVEVLTGDTRLTSLPYLRRPFSRIQTERKQQQIRPQLSLLGLFPAPSGYVRASGERNYASRQAEGAVCLWKVFLNK